MKVINNLKKYLRKASDTPTILLFFINVIIANLNNTTTVDETG